MTTDTNEIRELRRMLNERFDRIQKDIGDMKEGIDKLNDKFDDELQAQSSYRGAHAQTAANRQDLEIAILFADLHGLKKNRTKTRHIRRAVLESWVEDHEDMLLSLDLKQENALVKFQRPDIIAAVFDSPGNDPKPTYYIAVEASYTGERKDADRATDNAKILRAVTGLQAYPVVASVALHRRMDEETRCRLYEDVGEFIEANDPEAALLYRLDSADLRPLEPR